MERVDQGEEAVLSAGSAPTVAGRFRTPGWRDRGATLVEYAVILSLIVVVSIPAIDYLADQSSDEISNQADCVSQRPPPEDCQASALPPPPGSEEPGAGPAPQPTVPDGCVGDDCPPTGETDLEVEATGDAEDWLVTSTVTLELEDDDGELHPIEGANVTFQYRVTQPPSTQTFQGSCTTGGDGSCQHVFDVPYVDAEQISVTVVNIESSPSIDQSSYPDEALVDAP